MKKIIIALSIMYSCASLAHFQLIHSGKMALSASDKSKINLSLIFTHPFDGGHTLNMGKDAKGNMAPPR